MDNYLSSDGQEIVRLAKFPNYGVTRTGDVYSLPRLVSNGHGMVQLPLRKLLGNKVGKGYLQLKLYQDKRVKNVLIHLLVAWTFLPNDNIFYTQINHKDGNKENNNVDNLEWCDNRQNQMHAWRTGLQPEKRARRTTGGVRIAEIDDYGNIIKEYSHARHAEEDLFGVCKNRLLRSLRYAKNHGKKIFKYKNHKFIKL